MRPLPLRSWFTQSLWRLVSGFASLRPGISPIESLRNVVIASCVMNESEKAQGRKPQKSRYLLANSSSEAPARFAALSSMFDGETKRHLADRGVSQGWRCLEVGGGGGSIA